MKISTTNILAQFARMLVANNEPLADITQIVDVFMEQNTVSVTIVASCPDVPDLTDVPESTETKFLLHLRSSSAQPNSWTP